MAWSRAAAGQVVRHPRRSDLAAEEVLAVGDDAEQRVPRHRRQLGGVDAFVELGDRSGAGGDAGGQAGTGRIARRR